MSKIYEALLRAEMDRVAQINREPNSSDAPRSPELAGGSFATTPLQASTNGHEKASSPAALQNQQAVDAHWDLDEARLPALQSRGMLVEQVRLLRSRLSEMRLDRQIKSVLITSGLPEEGKSFVAANLSVALAKSKNTRVLLIDGDMRRGTLHKILGTEQEPGLAEYLAGTATPEEIMQRLHSSNTEAHRSLSTLTFIPSGRNGDNAADLSSNGRFELLLRTLSDEFEWIIVDSSPVTLVSDGVNLGRHCDGVLLVTRAGVTKYEVAQRAVQELKASKLLGVVLNAVEENPRAGGYYGYDS